MSTIFGKIFTVRGDVLYHTEGNMDAVTLKPFWHSKIIGNLFFQPSVTD